MIWLIFPGDLSKLNPKYTWRWQAGENNNIRNSVLKFAAKNEAEEYQLAASWGWVHLKSWLFAADSDFGSQKDQKAKLQQKEKNEWIIQCGFMALYGWSHIFFKKVQKKGFAVAGCHPAADLQDRQGSGCCSCGGGCGRKRGRDRGRSGGHHVRPGGCHCFDVEMQGDCEKYMEGHVKWNHVKSTSPYSFAGIACSFQVGGLQRVLNGSQAEWWRLTVRTAQVEMAPFAAGGARDVHA